MLCVDLGMLGGAKSYRYLLALLEFLHEEKGLIGRQEDLVSWITVVSTTVPDLCGSVIGTVRHSPKLSVSVGSRLLVVPLDITGSKT